MAEKTIQSLLLACLNSTLAETEKARFANLTSDQWAALLELAQKQRVAPLFYHHLKQHGFKTMLPPELVTQLDRIYRRHAMRSFNLQCELAHVLKALQAEKIPVLVLKGAYLAQAIYTDPALRYMVDSDIMVYEEHLLAAAEIVMGLGYEPIEPVQLESKVIANHLPPFFKPGGAGYLEVHWALTRPNRPYSIESDILWTRTCPFTIAGVEAQALTPEDLLLHLCGHAFHHHRFIYGVRPLYDIVAVIAKYTDAKSEKQSEPGIDTGIDTGIDWDVLCQRSRDWGWSRVVYMTLYLSHTLLGAAVPPQVLTALKPNDLPPEYVEFAQMCLFADEDDVRDTIKVNFMRVMGGKPFGDKAKLLMSRLLISREEVANIYHISADSPRLYLYYPLRLCDFLWTCSQQAWLYLSSGTDFKKKTRQFNTLVDWMEQA